MKILIVEDDELRTELFREYIPADVETFFALDAKEAIYLLNHHTFDIVFLDHDLGEGLNGTDVAKHIASEAKPMLAVVIHSWNIAGQASIAGILEDKNISYLKKPFGPDLLRGIKRMCTS